MSRWSRQGLEEKAQNGYFWGADFVKCADDKKGDVTHTEKAVETSHAAKPYFCGETDAIKVLALAAGMVVIVASTALF